jgi:predicted nucleotide-binding protein
MLENLISRLEEKKQDFSPSTIETNVRNTRATANDRVFLVHGQNEGVRESVARFLEHLDLHVIILHEQPDRGRTIVQKFKDHSAEAAFAIVLLTADDRGGPKEQDPSSYQLRARQNVIFELGFFIGTLERDHVCALYEKGVEVPSDYQGVLFVDLNSEWKLKLAHELKEAGLPVDLNKAF